MNGAESRSGAETPEVLCLMGPTGTGKSRIALALAEELPVEIVSVDSAMIYRGMDVGTDKPSPAERARVPHHLIDIRDPAERYSAGDFARDAVATIRAVRARGRMPLLVGGTFLYFRALTQGFSPLPRADRTLRETLQAEARRRGWEALHRELLRIDPEAATRIHVNDRQRIERALELYRLTGTPPSRLYREAGNGAPFRFLRLVLWPSDRTAHRRALAERLQAMLERGLVDEVRRLHARGDLGRELPAIRTIAYRQLWEWLDGDCAFDEAVRRAIVATQRYAKRQLTWLRTERNLVSVECGESVEQTARRVFTRLAIRRGDGLLHGSA